MSREAELIQKIDEHIREEGYCGKLCIYGLELPSSDLQVIRAALKKMVEADTESETYPAQKIEGIIFTAHRYKCPNCGSEKVYFGKFPAYCEDCGQALKQVQRKGGDPPSEE